MNSFGKDENQIYRQVSPTKATEDSSIFSNDDMTMSPQQRGASAGFPSSLSNIAQPSYQDNKKPRLNAMTLFAYRVSFIYIT